jgi:hypothetical protein
MSCASKAQARRALDVPQDEVTEADSLGGLPMFGDRFPTWP